MIYIFMGILISVLLINNNRYYFRYAQKTWLMVPFRNAMTPGQRAYNYWHRSSRSVVERTIGLLKQRWRYDFIHFHMFSLMDKYILINVQ